MTSSLQIAHDRVQRDLVDSERKQRLTAEGMAREYVRVLHELATLFDGERLEVLRREDPKVPQYWTPDEWRKFFAGTHSQAVKSTWGTADRSRFTGEHTLDELSARPISAETYQQHGSAARKTSRNTPVESVAPCLAPIQSPDGMTPPVGNLLAQARQLWDCLPATCPTALKRLLPGGGRSGLDLKKAYQRYWLTLYLIGACCLNAKFEIEDLLAMTAGMSSRAGSLSRIIEDLLEVGILTGQTLQTDSPKTSLRLLKFTPDGVRLFKDLFKREPEETDWERLARLIGDECFQEHSLAVLIFALHARKRGWATRVLPSTTGIGAPPDLLVMRGAEKLYVVVRSGQAKSPFQWNGLATLNASLGVSPGKVAICATTREVRQQLVGDCRLDNLTGVATDLETLVRVKHSSITDQTPLWAESW